MSVAPSARSLFTPCLPVQAAVHPPELARAELTRSADDARSARVLWMLGGIWLLSGVDYVLTVAALARDLVDELNPLAVYVHQWGNGPLFCYKWALLALGTAGLLRSRHLRLVEVLTIGVLVALLVVVLRWGGVAALYGYMLAMAPPGYPIH